MTTTLLKKRSSRVTPKNIAGTIRTPTSLQVPTPPTARMSSKWVKVTPATAESWLSENKDNRNIRSTVVARYARAMKEGRWTASPDAITFSTDGRLLNGQHRLHAITQSGTSVNLFVITNMEESCFSNMDRGVPRAYSDLLRSAGEANVMALGSVLGRAVAYQRTTGEINGTAVWTLHSNHIEDVDRNAYLAAHPDIRYSVDTWYHNSSGCRGSNPTVMAIAHHLIARATSVRAADAFLYQLVTQDREPANGTIRAACNGIDRHNGRLNEQMAIVLNAWNAWSAGRELHKIALRDGWQKRFITINDNITRPGL